MSSVTKHCPFCGSAVEQASVFCANCGASLTDADQTTPAPQSYQDTESHQYADAYQQPVPVHVPTKKAEQDATTALIFGILGWFCCPGIFSIVAIVLGHKAYSQNRSSTALIALLLGYLVLIGLAVGIILNIFFGFLF